MAWLRVQVALGRRELRVAHPGLQRGGGGRRAPPPALHGGVAPPAPDGGAEGGGGGGEAGGRGAGGPPPPPQPSAERGRVQVPAERAAEHEVVGAGEPPPVGEASKLG